MRSSRVVIAILASILIVHAAYFYPRLPAVIASHFDGEGSPDGWMSKGSFFVLEAVILLLLIFEFLGIPRLVEGLPNKWINLPNRDHWLSEMQRDKTFLSIRTFFDWFAAASLALFLLVNHMVFTSNIESRNLSGGLMAAVLIGYFAFVAIWLIMFVLRFWKVR